MAASFSILAASACGHLQRLPCEFLGSVPVLEIATLAHLCVPFPAVAPKSVHRPFCPAQNKPLDAQ
jgi:hypothetical protein